MPERQLWQVLHIRNSKLGKTSLRELGKDVVHLPKLHVEKKTSHVQHE